MIRHRMQRGQKYFCLVGISKLIWRTIRLTIRHG
jgi:hypothetical protein